MKFIQLIHMKFIQLIHAITALLKLGCSITPYQGCIVNTHSHRGVQKHPMCHKIMYKVQLSTPWCYLPPCLVYQHFLLYLLLSELKMKMMMMMITTKSLTICAQCITICTQTDGIMLLMLCVAIKHACMHYMHVSGVQQAKVITFQYSTLDTAVL